MMAVFLGIHVLVCLILISTILIQRGRGGGFVEAFSGLESVLGTKTSAFLSKLTSVCAVLFFVSCLNLAFFSMRESRSLMRSARPLPAAANATAAAPAPQTGTAPAAPAAAETVQPPAAAVNQTAQ
jgi:preprotein translocase subunit SecG